MTDNLDFDHVLSVCIDRLRSGDTTEACLTSYPSHASHLAPLLRVAVMMQPSAIPTMSADGFRAGQGRVLARASELRSRPRSSLPARKGAVPGLLDSVRRLIIATVSIIFLSCAILTAGTVSAASTSLPGSPLYLAKRASEAVVSSVAFTPQLQMRVHLAWADRRLGEIEALVAREDTADDALLAALQQETDLALTAAMRAGSESLTSAVVHAEHQHTVLGRLLETAPQAARPGLERALAASAQSRANARSALDKAKGRGPAATPPGQASPGPAIIPPGQFSTRPAGKKTPVVEPDDTGPPDHAGSPDDPGPPDHNTDLPDDTGPSDHAGPSDDPGPPGHTDLPNDAGPPDHAGPPNDAGPPDHPGPPDHAGRPDDKGSGRGSEKGGGKDK